MPKLLAAVAVSLIAGLAVGAWLAKDGSAEAPAEAPPVSPGDASVAALEERLLSLEQLFANERNARLDLEERVADLLDGMERSTVSGAAGEANDVREGEVGRMASMRRTRDFGSMMRSFEARRLKTLRDGGFSEDEARRILQKESEAEYRAMQMAWEAQKSGAPRDPLASLNDPQAILRAELGDSDYERFLVAQGQPTAVQITRVLDGSPASEAGLLPGDQLISYDGSRVFNVSELRDQTLQGKPGEEVAIEIDRDGVRMQLSVPRGPVGITGSGANIRTMGRWGGS